MLDPGEPLLVRPRAGLVKLACVLLAAAPLVWAGMSILGLTTHPLSGEPVPEIASTGGGTLVLCASNGPTPCPGSSPDPATLPVFSPAANTVLISDGSNNGFILKPLGQGRFTLLSGYSTPCSMLRVFPSSGAEIAAVGYCGSNLSLQFVSASTGAVVATAQLSVGGYLPSAGVYDGTSGYLYLAGLSPGSNPATSAVGYALTQVDTVRHQVTGVAALPNGSVPVSLCVGSELGTIIVADRGSGEVYPVNPASGSVVGAAVSASGVQSISFDPVEDLLFVSRQAGTAQPVTEVYAWGSATPKWVIPNVEAREIVRDSTSGALFLWTSEDSILAMNPDTGTTEGSLLRGGRASLETYVPHYHEFVVGQANDFGMQIAAQDANIIDTPGPAYSAIPLSGSATPLVTGIAFALVGAGQLARREGRQELTALREFRARATDARAREIRQEIESQDFRRRHL